MSVNRIFEKKSEGFGPPENRVDSAGTRRSNGRPPNGGPAAPK
jgi:hypothetical protein